MGRHKDNKLRPLTDLEDAFVDAFLGEAKFNPTTAYDMAGYADDMRKYSKALEILKRPAIIKAIHDRMGDPTNIHWMNETAVIMKLWEEANNQERGSTHAGRINALVWIGKHLGMWQDKKEEKEDSQITYNIVNYGVSKDDMKKKIEDTPEVEEQKDNANLPEGVLVVDYNEQKPH